MAMNPEQLPEPSITPPEQGRYRPACDDCGDRMDVGDAFVLVNGCYCLRCAAPHACEILDHTGSDRVTVRDVESAAEVLAVYAKVGKAKRLARFAGRSGPDFRHTSTPASPARGSTP